jgi:signal peptidase I
MLDELFAATRRLTPCEIAQPVSADLSAERPARPEASLARTVARQQPGLLSRNALWRDVAEIFLLIAVIYTFVNLATARAVVEGTSMKPNFETGQLVIVNRLAYFFGQPQRGDVVVLHNPRNAQEDFIKRVIGLPGEHVAIREGRVYINGGLIEEPYLSERNFCKSICDGEWQIGPDQYFVLGDNRASSHDSHSFGPIDGALIVGQAWLRYWPLPSFQFISHPSYDPVPDTYVPTPPPPPTITPTPRPTFIPGTPMPPDFLPGGDSTGA